MQQVLAYHGRKSLIQKGLLAFFKAAIDSVPTNFGSTGLCEIVGWDEVQEFPRQSILLGLGERGVLSRAWTGLFLNDFDLDSLCIDASVQGYHGSSLTYARLREPPTAATFCGGSAKTSYFPRRLGEFST